MKKKLNILLFVIYCFALLLIVIPHIDLGAKASQGITTPTYETNIKNNGYITYTSFYNKYTNNIVKNVNKEIKVSDYIDDKAKVVSQENSYGYSSDVIEIGSKQSYTFNINVNITGLYEIYFDYYFLTESILTTEGAMKINGDYQYYEMSQLIFQSDWTPETDDFNVDRYGNEIVPSSNRVLKWYHNVPLKDGSLIQARPMMVYLDSQKTNEIEIYIKTGKVLIGNIYLSSPKQLESYSSYISKYSEVDVSKNRINIQPEYISSKSDLSVRVTSEQDPSFSRYATSDKLLNSISHDSWSKGNQSITWEFDVEESKLYAISIKYIQYALIDLPVQRTISIDGEVPFEEFRNYNFDYTRKWKNETLKDENGVLYVYLEKGHHTITMTSTLEFYSYMIEQLDRIMDEMTQMSLQIKYLTNGQSDEYRQWQITTYIPELPSELDRWISEINSLIDYGNSISTSKKGSSSLSNLNLAIKKLTKLAKDPDQIPNELNNFTDGTSSTSQLLGDTITTLSTNSLGVEMIYIGGEKSLPKPTASWYVKMWESIKKFFISFFNDEYSINDAKDDEIEVWVNRSRQYLEVMQQLADEEGLKVKFSIMPDESKLILANASGDLPDVAMGVNNWIPYDLAIRGVTEDLRGYDGYEEVISNLTKGALIPYAYSDGMYGIPETQDFWVTYSRTDIMESIGLEVPSTWDDLTGMLPKLQSRGLNFYSPISAYTGLKPFVATLPLLYQHGGSLYSEDGMTTTLGSEANIEALKFMTNLFTIYDVPQEVPNFYNSFRYGTLPLGIANSATYIQLLVAAPEIQGNWDIDLHIGLENENGEVLRYSSTGSQGITMFKSSDKKQQAWDFIKWWMSTETQERFIEVLYSMYGLEYLWFTANRTAFDSLPISTDHKEIIKAQWDWAAEASRIPAAYMLERSISDAYSKVVFNGVNPRIAIDDAVIAANREIARKMEEFGYMKNGVKVKDYKVPSIYNIDDWLTGK